MSDLVDYINTEYDSWVIELDTKLQKLKILVRFSDMVDSDDLLSLLSDIKDKQVIL